MIGFSRIPGVGRVKLSAIKNYFDSYEKAWKAPEQSLQNSRLDGRTVSSICYWRDKIDVSCEIDNMQKLGIDVFGMEDAGYPERLKMIHDCPPLLFCKGELLPQDELCLAVVGSRKYTPYGKRITEEIVSELVANGITIVSGLARGIDTIAHETALECGGRSLAVFACGLDKIYPYENADLAKRLCSSGAILSEHPLGVKPRAESFPRRNRILSGLSLGVLVIEAGFQSGAMITANIALEQNREVFAVPGSIFSPSSEGTNAIIQEGAKLVRNASDILEELQIEHFGRQMEMKEIIPATDNEAIILRNLSSEPMHIDVICRNSGLNTADVSAALSMMELRGLVKQAGIMQYYLAR